MLSGLHNTSPNFGLVIAPKPKGVKTEGGAKAYWEEALGLPEADWIQVTKDEIYVSLPGGAKEESRIVSENKDFKYGDDFVGSC